MSTRVDIEIAVRGATQITNLQQQLNAAAAAAERASQVLGNRGLLVNSVENLSRVAAQANAALRSTAAATPAQKQALDVYVKSLAAAEQAELELAAAISKRRKELGLAQTATAKGPGGGLRGRVGGAISGSIIGGAFPLLFGQGGGAATGGAIGGLLGGLAGPGGSFAGSLLGTLIGDIASKGQAVKQLAEDIGFSAEQTKQLSDAFKVANTDVEKFTGVIQNIRGVGLEIEDQAKAIQLVTRLTEVYGGSFEKTGNAITSALESGKVSQATLNQLTSQGINVQDALAKKYDTNRDGLLKLAKDGKISVQDLINTLVDLGNTSEESAKKQENIFQESYNQISAAAVQASFDISGSFTETGNSLQGVAKDIQNAFSETFRELVRGTADFILGLGEIGRIAGSVLDGLLAKFVSIQAGILGAASNLPVLNSGIIEFAKNALAVLNPVGFLIDKIQGLGRNRPQQFGPPVPAARAPLQTFTVPSQAAPSGGTGAKGPKGPEDRTAQLLEDLEALKLISTTQDGIRDALFEGNKELAIQLEYDQKIADINRDAAKALLNANFESEKAVIRAQEIVRIKDAQLERDDQLRELARDIDKIIRGTLDDLRGGVTWDDTGLREIFDLRLPDAINEFQQNIANLSDPTNQIIGAATAIGDAFSTSFKDIVSGAVSAQQGLANFFKNVGDYFIDLSARILAEAVKLQAVQIISKIFSAALGSFGTSSLSLPGLEGAGALSPGISSGLNIPGYGAGAVSPLSVSPNITPGGVFAEGGFVTGPTRALIGEGGEPEYVIPASKMAGAMTRYAAGIRGGGVIDGAVSDNRNFLDSLTTGINGSTVATSEQPADAAAATRASLRETERFRETQMQVMNQQTERERRFERERMEQMASTPGNLNIRYESQVINNVEYVTREQAERLAAQSALRGRELAINSLQTSVKTRKRVGMA